ncbi:hypothetical protein BCR34DRAFT_669191 [Clohesyomyces aquaticus]|uniref:Uncharacterized protein n=1 Tax=Clohesyomyces aquaticus TaxID=1231657 RepID=A0A1Y1YF29_9PLEO|nr:hypothetical protein BCR34DRAFT_669191 [Clohesyomyces aquaticus]
MPSPPHHTLSILNTSGSAQRYGIFAFPPTITVNGTLINPNTVTRFIVAATPPVPNTVSSIIRIPAQLVAVCGTLVLEPDGSEIRTFDERDVTLSTRDGDGGMKPGTMWGVGVAEEGDGEGDGDGDEHGDGETEGVFVFDGEAKVDTECSVTGAFAFQTDTDFTVNDAEENGYQIGFGTNPTSDSTQQDQGQGLALHVIFSPEPNAYYEAQPGQKFVVAVGAFEWQDVVAGDGGTGQVECVVDFGEKDEVGVRQMQDGGLVVVGDIRRAGA